MSAKKKCLFCGKEYVYCNHCREYANAPEWKVNFDSEKCHDIYNVMAQYGMGSKTIEDVKTVLDKYEVTDYSIFSKSTQDKLNSLVPVKEEKVIKEPKRDFNKSNKSNAYVPNKFKKNNNNIKKVNTEE